jgi:transcriptional regulator with XRE-family HTH domain
MAEVTIGNVAQLPGLLRDARAAAGWTQGELAAGAGFTQSTVSLVESGHHAPPVASLIQWLAALGAELRIVFNDDSPAVTPADSSDLRVRTLCRLANGDAERIRATAGVTQTAMARMLGCGRASIERWESGGPPPRSDALLREYGTLLDDLAAGAQLPCAGDFGHDKLGVQVENLLRGHGISGERATVMSDDDLLKIRNMGPGAIRRIRECAAAVMDGYASVDGDSDG